MTLQKRARLGVGLIGLGRLGRVYARDLATRIPESYLAAVADTAPGVAAAIAGEYDVPRHYSDPSSLLDDPVVDAVVVVSPTGTHSALVVAALERGKATFCEKPPALTLGEALAMKVAAARTSALLQIVFMRRFDAGYAQAKRLIDAGTIGDPVLFKSSSRDPFPPSVEYADPRSSGGMIVDMGIHDFDLARWLMGEVRSVHAVGGALVFPELRSVGDIDNAVISLVFADGRLGVVDLSRNGVYGYDITTEVLGTKGTVRVGYLRETPLLVMTRNHVAHDTVPYFMERFEKAYTAQLRDFARNVLSDTIPSVSIDDGIAALRLGLGATRAYETQRTVDLSTLPDDQLEKEEQR
jgi:scyllo-inositol 2-dehydrogenase (NAD+)